ncbi:hypothetical protein BD410DRAFT_784393 [Rickenella mellea]|uniref:Methyltransferase domain-containing protein n=1 Tax=Rickenella mellea TaxID=50990 RepID=A0A4Y7QGH1_9AGAM|nr:hypothetical protein BD410DRAFT_784393 [Rickenella mellea]
MFCLVENPRPIGAFLILSSGSCSALPSSIDPKGISKVLDVAAGSLAWTLDLARTPGISTRLCPESNDPIRLYGCDISSAQFPPEEITSELGITVFVHDITTPFPEEMKRTFDLVNMRLLVLALSEQGRLHQNLMKVHVEPGGLLLIYEADTRYVRSSGKQAARKFEARVPLDENASDWMSRTNAVMQRSCMDVNGFIPESVLQIACLLC